MVNSLISDLYLHQAWADARHLRAVHAHAPARADETIRRRLLHIYTVQRFFLWMAGKRTQPFQPPDQSVLPDLDELSRLIRGYHEEVHHLVQGADERALAKAIDNPFAPPGAPRLTLLQSLTQCAMHSHYHRGQNAARLRELGGEPPIIDLIAWYWSGREQPDWGGEG